MTHGLTRDQSAVEVEFSGSNGVEAGIVRPQTHYNRVLDAHIDCLPNGGTVNRKYYAYSMVGFNDGSKKKRSHLANKKVLFHKDNERVHMCVVSMTK